MSDNQLMTLSTLEDIKFSIELIVKRFEKINCSDDFLALEELLSATNKMIVDVKSADF